MAKAVKLSEDFVEIARSEGQVMCRSISAQVEYWARLGRLVEASGALGFAGVRRLLAGSGNVQELGEGDDALYVGLLAGKLEALDGSDTRLLDDLEAGGHSIVAENDEGEVVAKGRPVPDRRGG